MLEQVGIRELRDRASEILRRVREQEERYVITYQGRPTALLIPINQRSLVAHLRVQEQRVLNEQTLTRQLYGLVKQTLSATELDELYLGQ